MSAHLRQIFLIYSFFLRLVLTQNLVILIYKFIFAMNTDKSFMSFPTQKTFYKRRKFPKKSDRYYYKQQQQQQYPYHGQHVDLRLIVLRHAERIDVLLGENWYDRIFGSSLPVPPQSYHHHLLPYRLPTRINTLLYVFDPPITRSGQQKSVSRGYQLANSGLYSNYCYSSPACRSVLTASGVLQGMNRAQVPIRIEPSLFEPMNWNTPLQELKNNYEPFMSTGEWTQHGYNIDRRYRPLQHYLNPFETEYDYFDRSQRFFQSIVQQHDRHHGRVSNVVVVGHAASPIIFEIIAQRQPFNAEQFGQQCAYISYLHATVLERNAMTRTWSIQRLPSIV